MNETEYRIAPAAVGRGALNAAPRTAVQIVSAMFIVIVLVIVLLTKPEPALLAILIGVVVVPAAAGILGARRRAAKLWSSFRILLSQDSIARHVHGLPELRIARAEVTALREIPGRGLVVVTRSRLRQLFVPVEIEGYADVRATLASWTTGVQEVPPPRHAQWLWFAIPLGVPALPVVALGAEDPRIVVPAGCLTLVVVSAGLVVLWRSPDVPRSFKWFVILLVPMLIGVARRVWTSL